MRTPWVILILSLMLKGLFPEALAANPTVLLGTEVLTALVAEKDLSAFSHLLIPVGKLTWPRLQTVNALEFDPERLETPLADRLAGLFFNRLNEFERAEPVSEPLSEQRLATYKHLIDALRSGGGYTNLVLMDATYRVVLGRLASSVVNKKAECGQAVDFLAVLGKREWDSSDLRVLVIDILGIDAKIDPWPTSQQAAVERALDLLGGTSSNATPKSALYTTALARATKENALAFLSRLLETQLVMTSILPGFCDFVQAGGNPSQIKLDDVRYFKGVMGNRRSKYGFEPLGFVALRASDLVSLISQFRDPEKPAQFTEIALR
jgi:hypothetical protein